MIFRATNQPHPWQHAGSPVFIMAPSESEALEIARQKCIEAPIVRLDEEMTERQAFERNVNVWGIRDGELVNLRWFDFELVDAANDSLELVKRAYESSNVKMVWQLVPDSWYLAAEKRLN